MCTQSCAVAETTSRINKSGNRSLSTVFRNRKKDVKEKVKSIKGLGGEGDRGLPWPATMLLVLSDRNCVHV